MTEQEASLIIRMSMALGDEGIGPKRMARNGEWVDTSQEDEAVLNEAVRVASHLFDEHYDLWEHGLVPDAEHREKCTDKPH